MSDDTLSPVKTNWHDKAAELLRDEAFHLIPALAKEAAAAGPAELDQVRAAIATHFRALREVGEGFDFSDLFQIFCSDVVNRFSDLNLLGHLTAADVAKFAETIFAAADNNANNAHPVFEHGAATDFLNRKGRNTSAVPEMLADYFLQGDETFRTLYSVVDRMPQLLQKVAPESLVDILYGKLDDIYEGMVPRPHNELVNEIENVTDIFTKLREFAATQEGPVAEALKALADTAPEVVGAILADSSSRSADSQQMTLAVLDAFQKIPGALAQLDADFYRDMLRDQLNNLDADGNVQAKAKAKEICRAYEILTEIAPPADAEDPKGVRRFVTEVAPLMIADTAVGRLWDAEDNCYIYREPSMALDHAFDDYSQITDAIRTGALDVIRNIPAEQLIQRITAFKALLEETPNFWPKIVAAAKERGLHILSPEPLRAISAADGHIGTHTDGEGATLSALLEDVIASSIENISHFKEAATALCALHDAGHIPRAVLDTGLDEIREALLAIQESTIKSLIFTEAVRPEDRKKTAGELPPVTEAGAPRN